MRWTLRVGAIAGIKIELHVTFIMFVGWIAISRGLFTQPARALSEVALILLVFSCVLLHELGHALAARRYGIRTRDIILLPIGGVARLERMPDQPRQEMVVAIAGPLVNVAIAGVLIAIARGVPSLDELVSGDMLHTLLLINIGMILFNLIPAFPMDGGRVLRAGLAMWLPYARATRIASGVGQGFALLFGLYGLFSSHFMLVFIALFVFMAAAEERAIVQTRTSLAGLPVHAAMVTNFVVLDVSESLQRAVDLLIAGSQQDFPVLDHGAPVGVLTRAELALALQRHGSGAAVGDVARRDGEHADASEPLEEAVRRMRALGRSALPVLHHGALVGLITLENVGEIVLVRDALKRYSSRKTV
jgi:Zn-dependent protease